MLIGAAAAAATLLGAGSWQNAKAITLTDGNSSVTFDPTSSTGISSWAISGQNQINKEWFWFRNGSTGGQLPVDTASSGSPSVTLFDTNGNGLNDTAMVTYPTTNNIQIAITFSLTGGASGTDSSDLTENIIITNKGTSAVNYHFFEYANFNLGGSTTSENVSIANNNTATETGSGLQVQTVVSPKASEYEANLFPSLLNHINSSTNYTLADLTSASNGDGEWGFQWDTSIPAGGSLPIAVDGRFSASVTPVPEPTGAVGILGLTGACLWRPRRRDEDHDPRTAQVAEA
jgi:MYXO-CTERM domain-containing protein